jgi:iron complex transport system substrate-binding protein
MPATACKKGVFEQVETSAFYPFYSRIAQGLLKDCSREKTMKNVNSSTSRRGKLRIVSLIPSATEIVAKLGYEEYLVGRSHECDYPPSVQNLPICTEPKFNPVGTSGEIHGRVTELLASALSVYRVNTAMLAELQPTHIITQAQCEVCAVSLSDVEQAVTELVAVERLDAEADPIQVVSLQPERLADVWTDMARVAEALDSSEASKASAIALIETLTAKLPDPPTQNATQSGTKSDTRSDARPTVACIEWTEPLMVAGNWVPELVALAGGIDCLGEVGAHSAWTNWEALKAADPDIIVVMPCGYDLAQTRQASEALANQPEWSQLKAVKNNRVYLTDGNQYFNRPGPRLVESEEILAEIIRGRAINPARQPVGWEAL